MPLIMLQIYYLPEYIILGYGTSDTAKRFCKSYFTIKLKARRGQNQVNKYHIFDPFFSKTRAEVAKVLPDLKLIM